MEKKIILQFDPALSLNPEGKHVRDGLSTVLRTGDDLWLCCDERITIERLSCTGKHEFGQHKSFNLRDYLNLPGEGEIDVEGLGIADNYLWLIGSHSLKRKKPRRDDTVQNQIKRLAKVKSDPNRYLLARIPLVQDKESGQYTLHKTYTDPNNPSKMLRAAQLVGDAESNQLTDALQQDKHLQDFMRIPGKDNGFDIEGLAVNGNRVFIGLRGPVLRGYAIVLEVEAEEDDEGFIRLKQLSNGQLYKKHFLQLRGKGIRELRFLGDDLYLLAGPTMDLDGVIAIYCWRNALQNTEEVLLHNNELERICEVPHGYGQESGKDKAEGLAIYDDSHVLIVFDSPTDSRKTDANSVVADLFKIT